MYVYSRNKSAILIYSFCLQTSPNHNPIAQSIFSVTKSSIYSETRLRNTHYIAFCIAPKNRVPAGKSLKEADVGYPQWVEGDYQ